MIGVAHPKWDERPLLIVVREGRRRSPTSDEVLDFLEAKIAKWWMPDDVQFVKEIPHTATGKINKLKLRETFKGLQAADGLRGAVAPSAGRGARKRLSSGLLPLRWRSHSPIWRSTTSHSSPKGETS